jgi:hypothetical protein
MGTSDVLLRVMALAFIGWLATSYRIKHSRIPAQWRKRLIVPLWFVWMALALGGPVFTGALDASEALTAAAGFSAGLCLFLLMRSLRSFRRSR